jgi:hypothetical protein
MKSPTHKTAHTQAPIRKPKLQLAKELFFANALTAQQIVK